MERTMRGDDDPSADAGQLLNAASDGDLTNGSFIGEFDERDGRYRAKYDSARATPSLAVITVVSHITGNGPLELEPLIESIDPDALDALYTADDSSIRRLTFEYSGYEITVRSHDVVEVVAE